MMVTLILFLSPSLARDSNKIVLVYHLPFESSYFVRIEENDIVGHAKRKVLLSQSSRFRRDIMRFTSKISAKENLKEYNSIDIRVQVRFSNRNNKEEILSFDKFGHYQYQNMIYPKDTCMLRLMEKEFTEIKWNNTVYAKS